MREVFISYKSGCNDATIAEELYQRLVAAGITCWMAPKDIPFGSDYDDCIVEAIETCKVMLVVFSHDTLKSRYVYEEVRIAYDKERDIIRFKLDDTQLKGKWNLRLGAKQWIEVSDDYQKSIPELIAALHKKLGKIDDSRVTQNIFIDAPTEPNTIPVTPDVLNYTVNGVSFKMIRVEGGAFMMGATPEQGDDARDDEKPPHQVTLSTYHIGETQVTQELWQAVMGSNPSRFKGDMHRPVDSVSWEDCQKFITRLNKVTRRRFRLPTEAEWEFAARGGNKSKGYKYAGSNNLDEVAWYAYNTSKETQPVGRTKGNELGLYDMSGNVWEWCQDWYGQYSSKPQSNPKSSSSGYYRVSRGGSWGNSATHCRVAYRFLNTPSGTESSLGLRLAL